ncbi:hypothetical protein B296_00015265 [Ensete ventricosum]|uniref:Uncharacterized protein n=1 Tax=Ensete ventricosum TaxID=4639 RepID=A0A427AXH2_ENSVE|nr:hypothetical protein B296_00015265 [Ensete ventricosum]
MKKCDDHKLCTIRAQNTSTIPNILAHGKSYEHDFAKRYDCHKLCTKSHAKSRFDRFFMRRLRIS